VIRMVKDLFYSRFLLALIIVLIILPAGFAEASVRDPYKHFFSETFGDFQEELDNAREQGKLGVLIFFEMDDCPFCHRMKQMVLNQSKVQTYFKQHFLNFSVDTKGDLEVVDFAGDSYTQKDFALKKNRVRATPVFAIYDLEGNMIARYTGATSGIDEFLLLGEFIVSGAYQDLRFSQYKRQHLVKK